MEGRTVAYDCPQCEGSGFVPDSDTDGFLDMECPECEGEGWIEEERECEYS